MYRMVIALIVITSLAGAQEQPLTPQERQQFVGFFSVSPATGQPAIPLRVYEQEGVLMGQMKNNAPTHLQYLGDRRFRPIAAPQFVLTFTVERSRATRVVITSPDGTMHGVRADTGRAQPEDTTRSGPLYDELARMDSLIFDATYVACDTARTFALLTDDIEFYHDRTGFHQGAQVRADFARLAESCPRTRGIIRRLVPNTLRVYPISGYGAVQMGLHQFIERGATTGTTARFIHLWRKTDTGWKLSRVLSLDHHITDEP